MSHVFFLIDFLKCMNAAEDFAVFNTIVLAFLGAFKLDGGVSSSFTGPGLWGRQCLTVHTSAGNFSVDIAPIPDSSTHGVVVSFMVKGERVDQGQLEAFIRKVMTGLGAQEAITIESRHIAGRPTQVIAPHIIMNRPASAPVAV